MNPYYPYPQSFCPPPVPSCPPPPNPIYISRYSDSDAFDARTIRIVLSGNMDITGATATFELLSYKKEFTAEEVSTKTLTLVFDHDTVVFFPLGSAYATLKLYDESGRVLSVINRIPFFVTNEMMRIEPQTIPVGTGTSIDVQFVIETDGKISIPLDDEPTEDSEKGVKSGGVYSWTKTIEKALADKIDAESTTRSTEDSALDEKIQANTSEITTAQASITALISTVDTLSASLTTETSNRESGDSTLKDLIDANSESIRTLSADLDGLDTVVDSVKETAESKADSSDITTAISAHNIATDAHKNLQESFEKKITDAISAAIVYRGSVASESDLPSNPDNGDLYIVNEKDIYVWNKTENRWDKLSDFQIDLSGYLTAVNDQKSDTGKITLYGTQIPVQAGSATNVAVAIGKKADSATTLAGYGITDAVKSVNGNTPNASGNVTIDIPAAVSIDTTLTKSGEAADAKTVGDALGDKQAKLDVVNNVYQITVDKSVKDGSGNNIVDTYQKISDMSSYYDSSTIDQILSSNNTQLYEQVENNFYNQEESDGKYATKTELTNGLADKQGILTAGTGINIEGAVISADDQTADCVKKVNDVQPSDGNVNVRHLRNNNGRSVFSVATSNNTVTSAILSAGNIVYFPTKDETYSSASAACLTTKSMVSTELDDKQDKLDYNEAGYYEITVGEANHATDSDVASSANNATADANGNIISTTYVPFSIGTPNSLNQSAIAIGYDATTGDNLHPRGEARLAIGKKATATGLNSTGIGNEVSATGSETIAIGQVATTEQEYGTAVGSWTQANDYSTAFGWRAKAIGTKSTAIGSHAEAQQDMTLALGHETYATAPGVTVIGHDAKCNMAFTTLISAQDPWLASGCSMYLCPYDTSNFTGDSSIIFRYYDAYGSTNKGVAIKMSDFFTMLKQYGGVDANFDSSAS